MTVAAAIEDWLEFGLAGRSTKTIDTCRMLANGHVIPDWGPEGPGGSLPRTWTAGSSARHLT